jgi:hypothetical protein
VSLSRSRSGCKPAAARNPEKKGTSATPQCKKAVAKACACAIFRADSHCACTDSRVFKLNFRGVAQNGEKGWRTDEVEVLTHISRTRGFPASKSEAADSLGGVIKKPRGNGLFTMPGLLKMKVVKKPTTRPARA